MTHRFRHVLVLAATTALLGSGAIVAPARADKPPAPPGRTKPKSCKPVLACADDLNPALDLESRIADNIWYEQVFPIDYRTADKTPGDVARVDSFIDSALWTGTYLAAQAFRYALAEKYLSKIHGAHALSDEERPFWEGQKAEAKSRVDVMSHKFHLLSTISKNWNHAFDPTVNPNGFGGGCVDRDGDGRPDEDGPCATGAQPGYLMRACVPTDADPAKTWSAAQLAEDPDWPRPYTADPRIYGPLPWDDGKEYFCEDGTSRDAYAGTTFGLLTAFDLVGPDDETLRRQLRDDILTLTDFASKYYWTSVRPHGRVRVPLGDRGGGTCGPINNVTRPAVGETCAHQFENFFQPDFFLQVPMARLNMASMAHHVANADPDGIDVAKWDTLWTEEQATQVPVLAFSEMVNTSGPTDGYYKFNLEYLTGFNVRRTVTEPLVRQEVDRAFSVMEGTVGDDVNAHFEAISHALTGDRRKLDDAVQHLRDWRDYRAKVDSGAPTTNSNDCGDAISCVPQDRLYVTQPPAPTQMIPGPSEIQYAAQKSVDPATKPPRQRAEFPLPVPDRPPTDFLWQRPPTQLDGGSEALTRQNPGIDYLLPYWMLRYYTEAEEPPVEPFGAWAGPSYR